MKHSNKNFIIVTLVVLAIMVTGFVDGHKASAAIYYAGSGVGSNGTGGTSGGSSTNYYYSGSGTNNSNGTNNGNNNNNNYNNGYNNGGTNTNYGTPVIYSISPNTATTGGNGQTIYITGANFVSGSVARFNSADRPTTYSNSGSLAMSLYPGDMSGVGTYLITVYNPNNGAISNAVDFSLAKAYVAPSPAPAKATTAKKTTGTAASTTSDNKNLTGNALFGSTFLPTTFFGWILLAILILLAVLLWRKLYVTEKDHAAPLKHV